MTAAWRPNPVDVSGVRLSAELRTLVERLAENAHDIWADHRLEQGWRLGTERDDRSRTTPLLVPYTELSEQERELDRRMVTDTVKALIALGYRLEPPG